jgi:hypothetical protein
MCTVSFIARKRGYLLAMNRDERLSRVKGLPPKRLSIGGRTVICPSEPSGGTWIALNDAGVTFTLINWYSVKNTVSAGLVSRGTVVKFLAARTSMSEASRILATLPLRLINPFRLTGFFLATKEVFEWRWDLKDLTRERRPWHAQQFISSGFEERTAQRIRASVFSMARRQKSFGTADWIRRLHRSHLPERGPFSTCMHRADAATVSYTEVAVSRFQAIMRYQDANHEIGVCKAPEVEILQ